MDKKSAIGIQIRKKMLFFLILLLEIEGKSNFRMQNIKMFLSNIRRFYSKYEKPFIKNRQN